MKSIEIISLIYKSKQYFDFIYSELIKIPKIDGIDIKLRIVGNDPVTEFVSPDESKVKYHIYKDPHPDAYYINRVYRCYNWAVQTSEAEVVCLINSDMYFCEGWLENLVKHYDEVNIPCSRLIESGKLRSGMYGISIDFGRTPLTLRRLDIEFFAKTVSEDKSVIGGLYMPFLIGKERFLEAGGYPEGNVYEDGIGTCNGNVTMSGDTYFFREVLEKQFGMRHITVFDSFCYHTQEGEKDS